MSYLQFVHLGREIGIGANSYLLEMGEHRIVLDAGLHPKQAGFAATPAFSHIGNRGLDAIVITHAHQDHVGSLPILTSIVPSCPVFMTEETCKIADVMLHNSVSVMQRQQEEKGISDAVLFTHHGVDASRAAWRPTLLRVPFDLTGERCRINTPEQPTLEFFPAGHILGSVGVQIHAVGKTIFYTGDVHFGNQTLMQAADFPTSGIDILLLETTRGDSPTHPNYTRETEKQTLASIIKEAFADDAAVTIPVFALGKTQEMLGILWELQQERAIPVSPIFIGGLSAKITKIYDEYAAVSGRSYPELRLFSALFPQVANGRGIDELQPKKHSIFLLSSGMLTENTLSNVFVRKILENPKQRLIFVGYSDPSSPAGLLQKAKTGEMVTLNEKLPSQPRKCQVHELNFSAHATRDKLLAYAIALRPTTILLVHGDRPAMDWFKRELSRALPNCRIATPEPGVHVSLSND